MLLLYLLFEEGGTGQLSRQQSFLSLLFSIALLGGVSVVFSSCFRFAQLIFPRCFQLIWVRTDLWRSTSRRNLKAGIQGTFEPHTVCGKREQVQISRYLVMPAAKARQLGKVMTPAYLHLCLQEQNYWPRNLLFFSLSWQHLVNLILLVLRRSVSTQQASGFSVTVYSLSAWSCQQRDTDFSVAMGLISEDCQDLPRM